MAKKNKGGRPTKYRKEFCQKLIDHMAQGYPYETFAATIDVSRAILYKWEQDHPEFLDSKSIGQEKCYEFLYSKGIENLVLPKGITFQSTVWAMMMKNVCKWRDNPENENLNEAKEITINYNLG